MMNQKVFALKKLQTELKSNSQINSDISNEVDAVSCGLIDDDYFKWSVMFQGPENTLYEGGLFSAEIDFPEDYPLNPPTMHFKSKMWHPNIYPDGKVCISILHPPVEDQMNEMERMDEKWRPVLGVDAIIVSVISMLSSPNLDSPANIDAAVKKKFYSGTI